MSKLRDLCGNNYFIKHHKHILNLADNNFNNFSKKNKLNQHFINIVINLQSTTNLYNFMFNDYEINDKDYTYSSPSKNKTKQITDHLKDINQKKFIPGTISKGFFTEDIRDLDDIYYRQSNQQINNQQGDLSKTPKRQSSKQKKVRKQSIKLQPFKQQQKRQVLMKMTDPFVEIQEINQTPKKSQNSSNLKQTQQSESKRRKNRKNRHIKLLQVEQLDKDTISNQKKQKSEAIIQSNNKKQTSVIEQPSNIQSQIPLIQQNVSITSHRNQDNPILSNNQQEAQVPHIHQQSQQRIDIGPGFFNFDSNKIFWKQLFQPIPQNQILSMQIIRDKEWLNNFWPEFHLHIKSDSRYIISAKKKSNKPISTFVISTNNSCFDQNTLYYLGKMKSQIAGNVFNIFGPGYSPSVAQQKKETPRQLLCTIFYFNLGIFQMGKPRQFLIYLKKPQYKYYEDFPQVKKYQEEISLKQLYQNSQNQNKIIVLKSRKPIWQQQIKGYILNFKGKVDLPSVKNFIVQQESTGPQLIIFGKISENKYNLDVSYPFSPYVAFALALTSFDRQ